MQILKPLQATHYNQKVIKDLSKVVSPPYDVISPDMRKELEGRSPYNFCHILLTKNDNYKALGDTYRKWIEDQILIDDDTESIYFWEHEFSYAGNKYTRLGILTLLQMDRKGGINPHEFTLAKPKADRTKLINEVHANLSPIFALVAKPLPAIERIYQRCLKEKPQFSFKDFDSNPNRIWKISDAKTITAIGRVFSRSALVIADGHHRFEVAHEYFKKNAGSFKNLNYILAYVTYAQKGLLVLPTHRVVSLDQSEQEILKKLAPFFNVTKVTQGTLAARLNTKGLFSFGICVKNHWYFLRIKSKEVLTGKFKDSIYKEVDTYILHELVFPLLTIKGEIEYTHSMDEAKRLSFPDKCAFILKAIPVETISKVAHAGFRLPQKSTYFYPKVPSGALIRRFRA